MKIKYYKELDGVRAIAALMVMFFHFFQHLTTSNTLLLLVKKAAFFGQTGVSLFFVLSGFLITRILIASKDSKKYFVNFYIRRSLRIFPLYYFYLILVFILIPFFSHVDFPSFKQQIYHWIYLQDFAITFNWDYKGPLHFWSLAVEEHFYLFFPLLVYYLNPKKLLYALIGLILITLGVRFLLNSMGYEVFYFTFTRMDELAIGALIALMEIKGMLVTTKVKYYIAGLLLFTLPTVFIWGVMGSNGNSLMQIFKFLLISGNYFFLIALIVSLANGSVVKKILSTSFFSFTGKISYGLYVYHGLCFAFIAKLNLSNNFFFSFIISFLFAYLVSALSFYLIESWFLKLKTSFQPK